MSWGDAEQPVELPFGVGSFSGWLLPSGAHCEGGGMPTVWRPQLYTSFQMMLYGAGSCWTKNVNAFKSK